MGMIINKVDILLPTPLTHQASTKEPEVAKKNIPPPGAVAGVASGAIAGSALGWLIGIYMLPISNTGNFMWAGAIIAAITGFGVGGMIGGTIGALIGMSISDNGAGNYQGEEGRYDSSQNPIDESDPVTTG